ncbi:MAG: hypothetical protein ABIH66_13725 [bacterium]
MSETARPLNETIDLLYVHPEHRGVGKNNIIPMGVFGLMNSVSCNKLGVMARDLTDELIARAGIIAMDLHWFLALYTAEQTIRRIRKVNPNARIIVGGYTATVFAEIISERYDVDFVIKGDAEVPFKQLVEKLLNSEDVRDVPNLVAKDFSTPQSFALTTDVYDTVDYITLDWFESFRKEISNYQKNEFPVTVYPFIPVFKGCIHDCEFCYGNPRIQKKVCGRGIVVRSPERVRQDLEAWSNDPEIRTVYMIMDFIEYPGPEYSDVIFSKKYDLNLYYEFFNLPPLSELDKALASFNRCFFYLPLVTDHIGADVVDFDELRRRLEHLKNRNCKVTFWVNHTLGLKFRNYCAEALKLRKRYGVDLMNGSGELMPVPFPNEDKEKLAADFNKYYKQSRKKLSGAVLEMIMPSIHKSSRLLLCARRAYTTYYVFTLFLMNIYVKASGIFPDHIPPRRKN